MAEHISVDLDLLFPLIQDKLSSGGDIMFGPKGVSMMPLIRQGIDSVKISPVTGRLKKYDVPLYRRKNGQFVLHRIVGVYKDSYVMCGDNQCIREKGITDDMIIGIMTEIIKPEGTIKITDKNYINYSKNQVRKQHLKYFIWRIKAFIKRILIKLQLYK